MQRKTLTFYEPDEGLSAADMTLMKKLKIAPSLYLNRQSYYNESKQTKWIGALEDKLPQGKGIFLLNELRKVVIVVQAKGGQKDGHGKIYLEDGSYYEVQFREDDCDGFADYFSENGHKILTANFTHDRFVELHYVNTGEVYLGEHSFLMKHGRGKLFKNQSQNMESIIYNGLFQNDKFIKGYAKLDYYVGDIDNGVYQGQGTLYYDKGYKRKLLSGTFRNGKLYGWGQEFQESEENEIKYEGYFVQGIYEGDGSLVVLEPEKRIYRGKFKNGEPSAAFDILDEQQRLLRKVVYKNGKLIEIREEYTYDIKLPSTQEITEAEIGSGNIETQIMAKVVYARHLGSVRFYRNMNDENPCYITQVDPRLFEIKYEGIVNENGALIYSGDMKSILFEGKGTLRYAVKNEPRKYNGNFANGLFEGPGELYHSNNKILYTGNFKRNSFHGTGKLVIRSIQLTGNQQLTPKELKEGTFEPNKYDVEVEGRFSKGKFVNGIWRYAGATESIADKVLVMKVDAKEEKFLGKIYEKKKRIFEGYFECYTFQGQGALYYEDGVHKKYEGDFKCGYFDGLGKLYDPQENLIYSGDFVKGVYNGKGKLYQGIEGNLIYEGEFMNGKIFGMGKMYESDGKTLRSEGCYENGVLVEGLVKIYDQHTHKLLYEGMIRDGLYEGQGSLYTSTGQVCAKGTFSQGKLLEGIKKEFHDDGSMKKEGYVKFGNYEGLVKEFYYDGKLMFEGEYQNGERNGQGTFYHRNGHFKQKGFFKDNVFYEGNAVYFFEDNVTKMFVGKVKDMYYNGPGTRYFENGALEYEGSFKNGLYDGEGIYYYFEEPGQIKFKGIFGDGRPDGEGEYYDVSGRLIYKGKFVNWKKEGQGVFYSNTGEILLEGIFNDDKIYQGHGKILWPGFGTLKYEGEFRRGYQEGYGKSFHTNGFLEYEGSFKENYFDGSGVLYSEDEEGVKIYEGKFLKGKYHGAGVLAIKGEIYEGEFRQGKKHGEGVWRYKDAKLGLIFKGKFEFDEMIDGDANVRDPETKKLIYSGKIKKGKYDGEAVKYYKNGQKEYEGTFKHGLFDGYGRKYREDGVIEYEGEYIRGITTGEGKIYKQGVLIYDGRTINGVYHGYGTLYDEKGRLIYQGNFNHGKFDGKGKLFHCEQGCVKYEGEFKDGIIQGTGKRFDKKGCLKYEGTFNDGVYHGEGILYYPGGTTKCYEGTFNMKVYDGQGKLYADTGNTIYEGQFSNGIYHGTGILYSQEDNEKVYYEGEFENGTAHGTGMFKYSNGNTQYHGEIRNGTYHGKGAYYYNDGKLKANGSFVNGKYSSGL